MVYQLNLLVPVSLLLLKVLLQLLIVPSSVVIASEPATESSISSRFIPSSNVEKGQMTK